MHNVIVIETNLLDVLGYRYQYKKPPIKRSGLFGAPLERLELSLSAPEADALSTELQGRTKKFYHTHLCVEVVQSAVYKNR